MMCLQQLFEVVSAQWLALVQSVQEGRNDCFVEVQQDQLYFVLLPALYVFFYVRMAD